jgi:HEPN domain-containing protein
MGNSLASRCVRTRDLAPRLHNLVRLAELAGVDLTPEQRDTLADMNAFALEGRYPESLVPPPSQDEGARYLARASEVFACLTKL